MLLVLCNMRLIKSVHDFDSSRLIASHCLHSAVSSHPCLQCLAFKFTSKASDFVNLTVRRLLAEKQSLLAALEGLDMQLASIVA